MPARGGAIRGPPVSGRMPARLFDRLVRLPPFLWLAAFFLLPFAITLKISLSEPATAIPPICRCSTGGPASTAGRPFSKP